MNYLGKPSSLSITVKNNILTIICILKSQHLLILDKSNMFLCQLLKNFYIDMITYIYIKYILYLVNKIIF